MENQIDQTKLINKVEKQSSVGILGIIKESLKTTLRNGKPMLAILLFTLYFFSILEVGEYLLSKPIPRRLSAKSKLSPQAFWYYAFHYAKTAISCVVWLFLSMATIHTTSEAHAGKPRTIKDAIFSVKGMWKSVFLTLFYAALILIGALTIFWMLFQLTPSLPVSDTVWSCVDIALAFIALVVLVYMLGISGLSLVVSAAEEGCEGLSAISRGGELVKGKKLQAWILTLLYVLCILGVSLLSKFAKTKMIGVGNWTPHAVLVAINSAIWVISHFRFVVLTVFYHQLHYTNLQPADPVYAPISTLV
nr:Dual specificity protein kinase [Ipomoea batatas]GMD79025.1 Dual specificity protein kinase [Ipomoea batatas]GMD80223.1 Dual specificity protein kinase [Ipomoea batatas]